VRALEICDEAWDQWDVDKLGSGLLLSMSVNLEPKLIAAWTFFERLVVASETNAGVNTTVKLFGPDFCELLGFGSKGVFGRELFDFRPRLWDHGVVFIAQLRANNKCECTTDCELIF
jgi:hypothetical protein